MQEAGFIGLGQMGRPMAMNLLRAPGGLVVGARKPEQLAEFERWGARTTTRLSDVAEAHVIFLCLPDGDAVEAVLFGPDGLAEWLRPDTVIVDTSTIAYAKALELAGRLANLRVHFLDAPVSGMAARAADGTLTVMCGGDPNVFESVRKHLDLIGNKIVYAGPSGSGQLIKLINQLLFDINAAALAEILPMSAKLGLNSDLVAEVVNSGTGRSHASEFFIPRILQGHFFDGYSMAHAYKDLVSGAGISANLCVPMPVLAAATATYQAALLGGHGDKDKGGMVRVFEDLLDVRYRSHPACP